MPFVSSINVNRNEQAFETLSNTAPYNLDMTKTKEKQTISIFYNFNLNKYLYVLHIPFIPIYSEMLYSLKFEYKPDILCAGNKYTIQMHHDGIKFNRIY